VKWLDVHTKILRSILSIFQIIYRNRVAKMKLVEQLTLVTLQTAHHESTSPRFTSAKNIGVRTRLTFPFYQPTKFQLIVNTKAAQQIGL